jgi:ATP-dependent Clp protease ATP-binding subunit ClpA
MRLDTDLQIAINVALLEAQRRRHEFAGLEHLLFALLHDPQTAAVVRACGADVKILKRALDSFLQDQVTPLPEGQEANVSPTRSFQRVVNRAAGHAESAGKESVRAPDVIVAFYAERDSWSVQLLEQHGIERLDLVSAISHGEGLSEGQLSRAGDDIEAGEGRSQLRPQDALASYTVDLVARAAQGEIDPLIGREAELRQVFHILARRRKNNPLLVGESGVGKTAIVEGFALRIHEGQVPALFQKARIYALDMGGILAGTRYRGDFEGRVKSVLQALARQPDAILFIDEFHTVVGAGAVSGGTMDASNLLKPALAMGSLRCIGATSHAEYRAQAERDRALLRRFEKVDVEEPPRADVLRILEGLKPKYEAFHSVTYSAEAVEASLELASRYLPDRRLPDSAIDLLDETGAAERLAGNRGATIARSAVEQRVSQIANIPSETVQSDERGALLDLENRLRTVIFGQDSAVARLVAAIRLSRAGLRQPDKPVGSFLLTGPTGVGKTELARQLAFALGLAFHRFDMSEYNERHTVSRLVGAPPGYVGFEHEGLLTNAVAQTPHCVVLLDEIEKACTEVFNLLLQIMDHGTLTDAHGRSTDFRQVVLLMTSNVGARDIARRTPGFGADFQAGGEEHAYRELFSPEFRNRLDARLSFLPLSPETMVRIVDKFAAELQVQLDRKNVRLRMTDAARGDLAARGYDPAFGARPLGRLFEDEIKRPLADAILFGALGQGGEVTADVVDGHLSTIFAPSAPEKTTGSGRTVARARRRR